VSVAAAMLCAAPLLAAEPERPALDVPYVPTSQPTVEAMPRIVHPASHPPAG
jgi:hypothetical protein